MNDKFRDIVGGRYARATALLEKAAAIAAEGQSARGTRRHLEARARKLAAMAETLRNIADEILALCDKEEKISSRIGRTGDGAR
jgi:acyl-CoA reductase-like NAD-dependent aldehyde dehydrogenase